MKLYAQFGYTQVLNSTQLLLSFSFGFPSTPNPTNGTVSLTVTLPTLLTAILIAQAVASAIKDYVNTTYGTSFTASDVIFIGSAVTIPSL